MEPLGRRSGDSFRSTSSYRQSYRARSCKKRLQQEPTRAHTAEKVRKHQVNKCGITIDYSFPMCAWNQTCFFFFPFFFACMLSSIHFLRIIQFLRICVCLFLFTLPVFIYHERIIEHLWAWTGFQLSHRRDSPPASSYQEAQPEPDQWDLGCTGGERQHQRQTGPQKRLFPLPKFWKDPFHGAPVASGCTTHNRHQPHVREQSNHSWQRLLRGQCRGAGEQRLRQLKLLIRSICSSGASLLTSRTLQKNNEVILFIKIADHRAQHTFRRGLIIFWIFILCTWWVTLSNCSDSWTTEETLNKLTRLWYAVCLSGFGGDKDALRGSKRCSIFLSDPSKMTSVTT